MAVTMKIGREHAYFLLIFIVTVIGITAVRAFNWGVSSPQTLGHSANEVALQIAGTTTTLQQFVDDYDIVVGGCEEVCNEPSTAYYECRQAWGVAECRTTDYQSDCSTGNLIDCTCTEGTKLVASEYYTWSSAGGGRAYSKQFICVV